MEVPQIVLAVVGALAGPIASIKVAALQAGRTLDEMSKRILKLEDRVAALETTEPEQVAKLRDDVDALAADLATVRAAVERVSEKLEKLSADEEKRRDKAADRAERREVREREQETALAAKLAEVQTLLRTMQEETRHARR